MKKIVNSISEAGTLMVEALAMLGLISMVTPVLYKKAAERTVELQDINASGQMRAVSSALDSFLKDNYTTITSGGKVTVSGGEEIDFAGFAGEDVTQYVESFSGENFVKALSPYLPYGFADDDGNIRETKLFNDYDFAIAMDGVDAGDNRVNRTLTGFMVAKPKNNTTEVTPMRAARIASMIGSNGGYVDDSDTARGTQGIWSVKMSDDLDINDAPENAIVVSSLQPVSAQSLDEELLHRVDKTDVKDRLNTMETDLFMGIDSETGIKGHNIRMVNQIIMRPNEDYMVREDGQSVVDGDNKGEPHSDVDEDYEKNIKNALYIADGGGANISGALRAAKEHFLVERSGIKFFGDHSEEDPEHPGVTNQVLNTNPTFAVDENELVYGNPVDGAYKLTVNSADGSFRFGINEYTTEESDPWGWEPPHTVTHAATTLIEGKKGTNAKDHNAMVNIGTVSSDLYGLNVVHKQNVRAILGGYTPGSLVVVNGRKSHLTQNSYNVDCGSGSCNDNAFWGAFDQYVWTGSAAQGYYPSGVIMKEFGAYDLTVNGAAFVRDTLLTGKIKTFDADFATLRAGAAREDLTNADDDDFFMKVRNEKDDADRDNKSFVVGGFPAGPAGTTETRTVLRVRDGENFASQNKSSGILMATGDTLGEGGINIMSAMQEGANIQAPLVDDNYDIVDWVDDGANGFSQIGMVKIGGYNGVYINSGIEAPVAINNDMYRAYRSESGGDIWSITNINSDKYYVRPSYEHENQNDRIGDYVIQDMITTVSASPENNGSTFNEFDVFNVDPTMDSNKRLTGGGSESGIWFPASSGLLNEFHSAIEMTGRVAIYDFDRHHFTSPQMPSFVVDKGSLVIRATEAENGEISPLGSGRGGVGRTTGVDDRIFVVDNRGYDHGVPGPSGGGGGIDYAGRSIWDNRGSVYIRKGSINIDSSRIGARKSNRDLLNGYAGTAAPQGYIAADRFIAHYNDADNRVGNLLDATGDYNKNPSTKSTSYEGYEVNPAYTSVMHDIKLTTRGGARLSDILPDFINKGIYVVNSTYKEGTDWTNSDFDPISTATGDTMDAKKGENVSAFLGFVPTPKCPPSYAKVVTLMPASWAMAQAGRVVEISSAYDVGVNNRPDQIVSAEDKSVYALDFQKSTWLKSMVVPYGTGEDFKGWSAIMGFIYPKSLWDAGGEDDGSIYWNLFPVKYKELEGYATVYCYFDRKNSAFNSDLVDHNYDQLGAGDDVNYHTKDSNDYIKRLNDPALKYKSPW